MAAGSVPSPNMETFDAYFRRADLDSDGRISGAEAVNFFQGSNLPKHVLAQIWMYSDSRKSGFLDRQEFYNALKLVTVAQRGRELTPEIVKAALGGPTAARIPAPQINIVATPAPGNQMAFSRPPVHSMMGPQVGTMAAAPSQTPAFGGSQVIPNANVNHQFFPPANGQHLRPTQALVGQGIPGGGVVAAPQHPNSNSPNLSTDWRNGGMGMASQVLSAPAPSVVPDGFGPAQPDSRTSVSQAVQALSVVSSAVPAKPVDPLSALQAFAKDSKEAATSANGFSSDSIFGGDIFSVTSQSKGTSSAGFAASSVPSAVGIAPTSSAVQASVRPVQNALAQSSSTLGLGGSHLQQAESLNKQNQTEITQSILASTPSVASVGAIGPASRPSDRPWPKFSQSDILKYSKVFVEVDKDRDGKITGEEARTLFLSWKLPREVLKQVWDLSDQDNDSMLSHREFVTALYLMERFREGYTLPSVLPNSVKFDETLLQATGQPSIPYGGPAWQPRPAGFPQPRMPGPQPVIPTSGLKPQSRAQEPQKIDDLKQPVPQKKSVPVLEKHLVYQLSKEEQDALNSKFQEATDADKKVQELEKEILDSKEKIEFYRTKMQELVLYKSRCDNRLNEITEKASADKREVDLLAKKYEEKYKNVGDVASKLTIEEATFREIQERKLELYNAIIRMEEGGSADGLLQVRAEHIQSDLDELVKSLNERCKKYGLRVKPTSLIELPFGWQPRIQEGVADWDEDWDKYDDEGFALVKELTVDVKNIIAPPKIKSPPLVNDKANKDEISSPVSSVNGEKKLKSNTGEPMVDSETTYAQSEDGSVRSPSDSPAGRSSLESASQLFHSPRFSQNGHSPRLKEGQSDHGGAESTLSGEKFGDEMLWGANFDTADDADSVWDFNSKDSFQERNGQSPFFDSGDFGLNPIRTDSPSASSVFGKEKSPFFADSVPGTPQYYSGFSPRFSEGPDDHSSDAFGRFDSFSMQDAGLFPPRESLARFDSVRSTSDQSRAFSFDDPDPFGSTGPFKSSETPRRASDGWSAF